MMVDTIDIADLMVSEVLDRWPATAAVFHEFNMACVGCAVAPYYSVSDAAKVYGISVDDFVTRLKTAATSDGEEADASAQ